MDSWSKLTKTVFGSAKPIEISVNSDVSHFNDGRKSVFKDLEHFGLKREI